MKTLSSFTAVAAIALFTLLLGCTNTPNSPTDSQLDKTPANDKQELSGNTEGETGSLPSFPTSFFTLLDKKFDVYVVRLNWGRCNDPSLPDSAGLDWSGSLSMNGFGALWVRRTINFEDNDHLLPRTNFQSVSWRSITQFGCDGIEAEIYLRNDIPYFVEPTLSFETGPVTVSFPFSQLQGLDTVIAGDGITALLAVTAKKFDRERCPHGPLGGHWRFLHEGAGKFEGTILIREDIPIGKMAGRFFTSDSGEKLFTGRWESLEGIFSGELRGRWESNPTDSSCTDCGRHSGRFKGEFLSPDGRKLGNLHGRFGPGSDLGMSNSDPKIGRFKGFWGVECDRDGANAN